MGDLTKMKGMLISGNLLLLIGNFLHNREQRVIFNSQAPIIGCSTPQGPLLSLIYVNDITDDLNCDVELFADDSFFFPQ